MTFSLTFPLSLLKLPISARGQYNWSAGYRPPCEQSLSKIHHRASKRGSAEIVSSLLRRCSPSFWAGQTGLVSALIVFLTRGRSKSIWRLEVRSRLGLGLKLSPSNGLRILNKDLTRFLQSPFFLVEIRKALLAGGYRRKGNESDLLWEAIA